MIVEYIRYQLKTHTGEQLIAAYQEAGKYLQGSPFCLSYELAQCSDDAASFVLRIEWTNAAGHVDGFRKSAEFPVFLRAIRAFFPEIAEMRHYEPAITGSVNPRSA